MRIYTYGNVHIDIRRPPVARLFLLKADFFAIKSRRNMRLLSGQTSPSGKCDPGEISSENLDFSKYL